MDNVLSGTAKSQARRIKTKGIRPNVQIRTLAQVAKWPGPGRLWPGPGYLCQGPGHLQPGLGLLAWASFMRVW